MCVEDAQNIILSSLVSHVWWACTSGRATGQTKEGVNFN